MKQNTWKKPAVSAHSRPSAWRVARQACLIFSGALMIAALAGCANTLPSVDAEEYTKWSKAHLDLPIYPGSYKELSAAVGGSESYMVSTSASVADVRTYYLTEPQKQGWHADCQQRNERSIAGHHATGRQNIHRHNLWTQGDLLAHAAVNRVPWMHPMVARLYCRI
jgi:hypothetical protein